MNTRYMHVRCARCTYHYIGQVCNVCKLGRDGKDYK